MLGGVEAFVVNIIEKSHLLKESEMNEDILLSKQIINMICEISDNVGKVYAVPFWSQHSMTCVQSLMFVTSLVNYLVYPNSESYQNFLVTTTALLLSWFILLIMFGLSIWMKNQAEKIVKIGLQVQYKLKKSTKVIKFAQLLSLQLHHRPPLIFYGVFVVDWKFLFATFCVILGDILVLL
ncbi:CLUMA_CG001119, isoform A [Clunio marinus]|uniref:CLUMA_CG001119, isoform A n=1 Tax=Clunio marinus TaxID=568069 RepID=A0A1J1HH37_9DIPT|nr:CLUMA_CG001119, isoform A [Clunio marinus]